MFLKEFFCRILDFFFCHDILEVWFVGRVVRMLEQLDLRSGGHDFNSSLLSATLGKLFTHVPLSPSIINGTSQWAVNPCIWKGDRRSGVTVVTHHGRYCFSNSRLKAQVRQISASLCSLVECSTLLFFILVVMI